METCANLFGRKSEQKTGREPAAVFAAGARSAPGAIAFRACSACAGDYEDPDRTAWPTDESEEDELYGGADAMRGGVAEEFPAEE